MDESALIQGRAVSVCTSSSTVTYKTSSPLMQEHSYHVLEVPNNRAPICSEIISPDGEVCLFAHVRIIILCQTSMSMCTLFAEYYNYN